MTLRHFISIENAAILLGLRMMGWVGIGWDGMVMLNESWRYIGNDG